MAGTVSTNYGVNAQSNTQPKKDIKPEPQKSPQETDKKISTAAKLAIGASALAAVVIAGVALKNKSAAKKLAQQFKENTKAAEEALTKIETKKSVNTGSTVQETIENVFGKNSSLKPHTYDTAQEYHSIACYRNQGGYKDGHVARTGELDQSAFKELPKHDQTLLACSISTSQHLEPVLSKNGLSIKKGVVQGTEQKMIRFEMADPAFTDTSGNPTNIVFSIISPNNQYTPVQKDLLKLAENPKKIDKNVFDRIFKFKNDIRDGKPISREDIRKNYGKYENLDYDLILSAIQSMAGKI